MRVYGWALNRSSVGACHDLVSWRARAAAERFGRPLCGLRNSRRWAPGDCPVRQLELSAARGLSGSSDNDVRILHGLGMSSILGMRCKG